MADDSGVAAPPKIIVSPEQVDLGVNCSPTLVEVGIGNSGQDVLVVDSLEIEGDNWGWPEEGSPELPWEILPGGTLYLELASGDGDAHLHIGSNDPDQPTTSLPLSSEVDELPQIQVLSPLNGEILGRDGAIFQATISDDLEQPQDILLQWHSDIDGILNNDPASAEGVSQMFWHSGHTTGWHDIRIMAMDACGNITTEEIEICQKAGYAMDTLGLDDWTFEGSALWDVDNEWLELTSLELETAGSAFATTNEVSGAQVEVEFLFYIGEGTGSEGLSLTALDSERVTSFLGGSGCGMGYGGDSDCTSGPALPGWSVEVDSHYNEGQDPSSGDHLMFSFDGDISSTATWVEIPEMEDTGWHHMRVQVNAPTVQIAIDDVIYIDEELSGYFDFPAYLGFTAATGTLTNRHLIDAFVVTELTCVEE